MIVLDAEGLDRPKTIDGTSSNVPRPFFRMNDMEKPDAWFRG